MIDRILRERWVLSSHTMAEALLEKDIKLVQDQITDLREDMGRVDGRSVEDSMLRESLQIRLQYSLMELAKRETMRSWMPQFGPNKPRPDKDIIYALAQAAVTRKGITPSTSF